jgi:hypothetical protein
MNEDVPRFHGALLTVLVIASVISVKMAFLYATELIFLLLITVPAMVAIGGVEKSNQQDDQQ